jgi:type IX secretion system PorP/SprF family membrane protein
MKTTLPFFLLVPLLAFAARSGQAQQMAQYSQYMNNNYLLNPAVAGTEDYIDVKLSYRAQWTGIEGAPRTYYASVNSSLGDLRTQSKRTLRDWQGGFHALGAIVYSDVTGPTSRTGLYGSYTYNLAAPYAWRWACRWGCSSLPWMARSFSFTAVRWQPARPPGCPMPRWALGCIAPISTLGYHQHKYLEINWI